MREEGKKDKKKPTDKNPECLGFEKFELRTFCEVCKWYFRGQYLK